MKKCKNITYFEKIMKNTASEYTIFLLQYIHYTLTAFFKMDD